MTRNVLLILFLLILQYFAQAQSFSLNFQHLTTANGLSDPVVRSITQDKYGYIWMGTLSGLNRFNGYNVKVFRHTPHDSFSLPENYVPALLTDDAGNLWVAQGKGIYKFDYNTAHFIMQPGSNGISTSKMIQKGKDEIYLASVKGLVLFNTAKGTFTFLHNSSTGTSKILLEKEVNDFCIGNDKNIYIATDTGLVVYYPSTRAAKNILLSTAKGHAIKKIAADKAGNIWAGCGENGALIIKTDTNFVKYDTYRQFLVVGNNLRDNRITSIFCDTKGRLWVATASSGLCLYDTSANNFIQYEHDPLQSMSISDNLVTHVYQDKQGYIWLGTEGYGLNYFNPDKTFFHAIQPSYNQSPTLPDYWCRAAGEDNAGNLWLGTASGLAKYNPEKNSYRLFQNTKEKNNVIQYNSIRSVLCDSDVVWIGTGQGLNRYHISSGKMDFLGEKDGVPVSFFWTIVKDHANNIWFGCREGIYRYNSKTKKFESLINNSSLTAYCKYNTISIFEDSQNRMWFGFYSKGLLMYNPANGQTKHWIKNLPGSSSLSGHLITSIAEDKTGIIWAATGDGLNWYDSAAAKFIRCLNGNGIASEKTSSLLVDNKNRLWFAGSTGLLMLDAERKNIKSFNMGDGLPTVDFNNQGALQTHNGSFIYPTLRGFIQFYPDKYEGTNNTGNVYVSSFKIYGNKEVEGENFEEKDNIALSPDENFFSLEMVALNYGNPQQSWYAHKLEPFDKDWIYRKERLVSYTNVPGGDYVFHYKTSVDENNWNVPEKTIRIYVATVFYKTWWFRLLTLLVAGYILFRIYKWRTNQKDKVIMLQSKAHSLEKEKAMVMYESLKQQLNPHFLFNSLSSLGSLITSNPANAKKFLEKMSKIYRYILKSRDSETVPLSEEIKLAETYTQLQQTRFKEGLQLNIDIADEYLHRKIAPVTLQNLIENAIKHNIIDAATPLVVNIFIQNEWLVVQNNLQRKNFVESSNKQGLAGMQSLYYYLGGKQIVIQEDEKYFTIKIPLL
ncbi:MAG: two-component regulator propeller domain-containing protein [Ferruginibacter sp.]